MSAAPAGRQTAPYGDAAVLSAAGPTVTRSFCAQCLRDVDGQVPRCPACEAAPPAGGWPRDPFAGELINDKYRIEARLGCGGFGVVYRARQLQQGVDLGPVALKFLYAGALAEPSLRARFINEARAARRIGNPHVVQVFELDSVGDVPFIAMELIAGQGLDALREEQGRLPPARTLAIAVQVAQALEACHAAGVVHRDLKPGNVLLCDVPGGELFVKVIDFGIARSPAFHKTSTGFLLGSPKYMPPEQLRGEPVDGGADIFALGVLLYECLAGCPPIVAASSAEYMRRNIEADPVPLRLRCPELPVALEQLLERMLAKRRADRPPSMADVALRLRSIAAAQGWLDGGGSGPPLAAVATELAADDAEPTVQGEAIAPVGTRAETQQERPSVLQPADAAGGATFTPTPRLPSALRPLPWIGAVLLVVAAVLLVGGVVLRFRGNATQGADGSVAARDAALAGSRDVAPSAEIAADVTVGAANAAEACDAAAAAEPDAARRRPRPRRRDSGGPRSWGKVPGGL